jgi:hypothetical protein
MINLTEHVYFDNLMILIIVLNSLLLALDTPESPELYSTKTNHLLQDVLSFFFVAETFIRIVAQGFILSKNAYLRDKFNFFDFLIVLVILVTFIIEHAYTDAAAAHGQLIRCLKVLKAFRPLKMARTKDLRQTSGAIIKSFEELLYIGLMDFLIIFIFGIIGVQQLSGRLGSCKDD